MLKRIFSVLLTFTMLLGVVPTLAFAKSTEGATFPSGVTKPKVFLDFNDKTAKDGMGNLNGEIVGAATFIDSADGTYALHIQNSFGKGAKQYLKIPNVKLDDGNFTIAFNYRASGCGGFENWSQGKYDEFRSFLKFKGFDDYTLTQGGTVFSNTDTSNYLNRGVSLLNLPSSYDGVFLASDTKSFIRRDNLSLMQDTKWHNIVISVNRGTTADIYLDGELYKTDFTTSLSGSLDGGKNTLNFGADALGNYGVGSGDFDNIAVFDYALNNNQVTAYTARNLFANTVAVAKNILSNARIGTRFSAKAIADFGNTVTAAETALNTDGTDYVAARKALNEKIDAFQTGNEPIRKIAIGSDTHILSTKYADVLNNESDMNTVNFLNKAISLGCETYLNAGDYSDNRDVDNQDVYFKIVEDYFLDKSENNVAAMCIGNHQYSHTGGHAETGSNKAVDISHFMLRSSDYIDPTAQPNRSIVDSNGKLQKSYYYVTDGVANYITLNPFENGTPLGGPRAITAEQWEWLFNTLDYCKGNKLPTFIISHQKYSSFAGGYSANFKKLMENYKDVTLITGDAHDALGYCGLEVQRCGTNPENQLFTIDCPAMLDGRSWKGALVPSGYFMYLYDDCYVLRCYDVKNDAFLPEFEITVYFSEYDDNGYNDDNGVAAKGTAVSGLNKSTAESYGYSVSMMNSGINHITYDNIYKNNTLLSADLYCGDTIYNLDEATGKYVAQPLKENTLVNRAWDSTFQDRHIPHINGGNNQTGYITTYYLGNTSLKTALNSGTVDIKTAVNAVLVMDFKKIAEVNSLLIGNGHDDDTRLVTRGYDIYIAPTLEQLFSESNKVLSYMQSTEYVNENTGKWYYNSSTKEYSDTEKTGFKEVTRYADSQYIVFNGDEVPCGRYVALVAKNAGCASIPRADIGEFAAFSNSDKSYCNVLFKATDGEKIASFVVPKGKTLQDSLTSSQIAALNAAIPAVKGLAKGRTIGNATRYWNRSFGEIIEKDTTVLPIYDCAHGSTKTIGKASATATKDGGTGKTECADCGRVLKSNTVIYKASNISLSTTSYTYDGKVKTPTVTVKTSKGAKLSLNKDYTVSYASGRKNAGTYKVTVKLKGNYSGTVVKTFKINAKKVTPTVSGCKTKTYNGKPQTQGLTVKVGKAVLDKSQYTVKYSDNKKVGTATAKITLKANYSGTRTVSFKINPKAATLKSVKGGKKKITVKWNKQATETSGYQIQYSTSEKFKKSTTVTVSGNKNTSKTVKKLKGGKKYYVRVRTYKKVGKTKYYSAWSSAKSATAKK